MLISVIASDRTIVVGGLAVQYDGGPADDSVATLQYDTDAVEGIVTYIDKRSEGFKDPERVAGWLALWSATLALRQDAAAKARAQALGAYQDYLASQASPA